MPTVTPPTPDSATPAPPPAPALAPSTRRRNTLFKVIMWAATAAVPIIIGMLAAFIALKPSSAPPVLTKPVDVRKAAPAKKAVAKPASTPAVQAPSGSRVNVDVSTPAGTRVKVNVEEGTAVSPAVSAPTPQPIPAPAPAAVTTPAPKPVVTSPVSALAPGTLINVYPPAAPPPVVQPTGVTLQLNIFSNGWGGGSRYYGPTYGWTPGHEELRYDPRTGTYYRVWIAHSHPGY